MIIISDVYKRYRTDHGPGPWVLRGVTLTIPLRTSIGLIGGNGAGKSTLLRLIGGVDQPNRGSIERNCRVSWPMAGGGLQKTLTGRQNAKFVFRIHGHENDLHERLARVAEFSNLGEAFDEPVNTYSSGMRSRLNFALSLAFDFDFYICDEITSAADAAFRRHTVNTFRRLADHAGLIMVSHDEGTLREFCSAGVLLERGRVHWYDDIEDALMDYKKSIQA